LKITGDVAQLARSLEWQEMDVHARMEPGRI